MRHSVFLSYRRADTSGHAGRLCDDLARRFGTEVVFRDVSAIGAGRDFVAALDQALTQARVVLVLIGDTWLSAPDAHGGRRLDDPQDHVRNEVATALARHDLAVVPVLVEGASMPDEPALPLPLRPLARRQAIELSEARWAFDLDRLAAVLERAGVAPRPRRPALAWWGSAAALAALLGIALGAWLWLGGAPPATRYTGLWHLPNGSYWTVIAEADALRVEETHYESRQVWKRGRAAVDRAGMTAELELVFERQPYRFRYQLALADDNRSLIGTQTNLNTGAQQAIVLTRD